MHTISILLIILLAMPASTFAEDATLDFDMPIAKNNKKKGSSGRKKNKTGWDRVDVSLFYQLGHGLSKPARFNNHHLDANIKWDDLVNKKYFLTADVKLLGYLPEDQSLTGSKDVDWNYRAKEIALQSNEEDFSFKVGYQSVIWGEMDSVQINDVITPWDYSEFAFTSPDDARIGQPSVLLDYFSEKSRLSLVFVPYPEVNRFAGGYSSLLKDFIGTDKYIVKTYQPKWFADHEVALRFKHSFSSRDIAFYVAEYYDNLPLLEYTGMDGDGNQVFHTRLKKSNLFGFSFNYNKGNLLWKGEAALKNNVRFATDTANGRDVVETAFGFDYNANGKYSLSTELFNQRILPDEAPLQTIKGTSSQAIVRFSKSFKRDTINTVIYGSHSFQYKDQIISAVVQYKLRDDLRLDANITWFEIKDKQSPMKLADNWDQLILRLSYFL